MPCEPAPHAAKNRSVFQIGRGGACSKCDGLISVCPPKRRQPFDSVEYCGARMVLHKIPPPRVEQGLKLINAKFSIVLHRSIPRDCFSLAPGCKPAPRVLPLCTGVEVIHHPVVLQYRIGHSGALTPHTLDAPGILCLNEIHLTP